MKSAVIIFPGSNCDRDMDVALKKFGFKNEMVWHDDEQLPKSDLIVLPGGFSYGDYLRCGSIAGKSKIIKSVVNFAAKGGLVLGICNGFQILTETGLLSGVLQQKTHDDRARSAPHRQQGTRIIALAHSSSRSATACSAIA